MKVQRLHRPIAIACIAMAATTHAAASTWRCGSTYTDQPCPGGQALPMDAAPGTERVRAADEQARQTQAAAARMEAERLRRDRERPALVHLPAPSAAKAPVEPHRIAGRKGKGRKADDLFTAAGPGTAKAPRKKKAAKAPTAG
ncbi:MULTISPECIES: hypothetical protein [unclassified Variovorax]|uniref:hypothetical protein n=1 Tax=unclassified Variovorax TaxID=663243 RepID=UPI002578964C|nr:MULTISPECIES: hypothetical protein [unclassified Variovorax]MDM0091633.1 hypothetical protein [Variovorax sp. J22G40]MDM0145990.1 hypothetical protein [Variovorax sp. J2P1-31]